MKKIRFSYFMLTVLLIWAGCLAMRSNPKFTDGDTRNNSRSREGNYRSPYNKSRFESQLGKQVDKYMGVPYKWGGDNSRGMDCSGFVSVVFRQAFGLELPRSASDMYRLGEPVAIGGLMLGDLVFFQNIESAGISHVGIYMGEYRFAHASTTHGVIMSGLNQEYYHERYVGAKRIYNE